MQLKEIFFGFKFTKMFFLNIFLYPFFSYLISLSLNSTISSYVQDHVQTPNPSEQTLFPPHPIAQFDFEELLLKKSFPKTEKEIEEEIE